MIGRDSLATAARFSCFVPVHQGRNLIGDDTVLACLDD